MTDWQDILTGEIVAAIGRALTGAGDLPDYQEVLRALDNAKNDAGEVYVSAAIEACAAHGITAKVDRPVFAPTQDHTFIAYDDDQNGEPGQLMAHGRSRVEAAYNLLQEVEDAK